MADIQRVDLKALTAELKPKWYTYTTFKEYFGMWMAVGSLVVVAALIIAFFAVWAASRPTPADAAAVAGTLGQSEVIVLRELRAEHFEEFRDAFQLFVLSGMVPLFTLLAGYTFGSARKKQEERGEE